MTGGQGSGEDPKARAARLLGIGAMCGAVACFACLDATAKFLTLTLDPWVVVWARYASAFVLTLVISNPITVPDLIHTRRPLLQAGRGALLFGSTALNFFALMFLQLDQTISIMFATPLVVALIAGPLLGEFIGTKRWIAIGVGFAGVLVMTRPGIGDVHPAVLLSLAGVVCYAIYNVVTRVLSVHDGTPTTLFFGNLVGFGLSVVPLPLVWQTPADWLSVGLMIAIGVFGSFGHFLLIWAHRRAPAPVLSPFIYTQLVWMILFGWLIFGDRPDTFTLVGASIVIASGLYLLTLERRR